MTIFWVGALVVLLAFVLSFFLKATPLREKSAMQEAADDRAADAELETEAALAANESGSFLGPQTGSTAIAEPEPVEPARGAESTRHRRGAPHPASVARRRLLQRSGPRVSRVLKIVGALPLTTRPTVR